MEKKWWLVIIAAVVLILIIIFGIIFLSLNSPKETNLTNQTNSPESSLNNNPATTTIETACLKEGQSGISGRSNCCPGLEEKALGVQSEGSPKLIVCSLPSTNANTYCTQDSECSSGLKCWKEVPTSLRAGVPGTATQPGVCSQEVGNIQE